MKSVFSQMISLILLSTLLVACSGSLESTETQGQVQVRLPWYSEKEGYILKVVQLQELESLYKVSGKFARFFFAPRISHNRLEGIEPKARFIKSQGVFVPANDLSQQMATIYAHMQNFAALDKALGAGEVNNWPRSVGVGVRMSDGMTNNAFYDGGTDSLLFVPYSNDDLPLAVNAGILAHEHFHSLFYKLVVRPLLGTAAENLVRNSSNHDGRAYYDALEMKTEFQGGDLEVLLPGLRKNEESQHIFYHLVLTRALNEGIADFWAWIYTGDADFIAWSLPQFKETRTLNTQAVGTPEKRSRKGLPSVFMPTRRHLQGVVKRILSSQHQEKFLIGYSYQLGTTLSRLLKSYTEVYGKAHDLKPQEARREVGRLVIQALPIFAQKLSQVASDGDYYQPGDFFKSMLSFHGNVTLAEHEFFKDIYFPLDAEETPAP